MNKIYCAAPFKIGFTNSKFGFRNCCSAHPQINSGWSDDFSTWWNSEPLENFRKEFGHDYFPNVCHRCELSEKVSGNSFRIAINKEFGEVVDEYVWPQTWNIMFGNVCNLGCWTCDETSSSVIEKQKAKIGILPKNYTPAHQLYKERWVTLKHEVLKSYEYHPYVSLTILGGEPLYNKDVVDFLQELSDLGLAEKTKLEFHTNATILSPKIKNLLENTNWKYTVILLSLDAVGKKAEWLRYGCKWSTVLENVKIFNKIANYVQVNCTLSVLNIMDLPQLHDFCQEHALPLSIITVDDPDFMSLSKWPGPPELLVNRETLDSIGYGDYYDSIGTTPDHNASLRLKNYIQSFRNLRKPLSEFDLNLAKIFGVD